MPQDDISLPAQAFVLQDAYYTAVTHNDTPTVPCQLLSPEIFCSKILFFLPFFGSVYCLNTVRNFTDGAGLLQEKSSWQGNEEVLHYFPSLLQYKWSAPKDTMQRGRSHRSFLTHLSCNTKFAPDPMKQVISKRSLS